MIAIIGILIALLLPAVQAAREAARRAQCTNNLKQLGLALHNHHDTYKRLPPSGAQDQAPFGTKTPNTKDNGWGSSWLVYILPYVEQNAIYQKWQFTDQSGVFNSHNQNLVANLIIPGYVCPSSPLPSFAVSQSNRAAVNYVGITGAINGLIPSYNETRIATTPRMGTLSFGGVLIPNGKIRFANITDGTSNTLAVSEHSDYLQNTSNAKVDWRASQPWGWSIGIKSSDAPPNFPENSDNRLFNATTIRYPINQKTGWTDAESSTGVGNDGGANIPLNSAHPGGVNVLMCDGSVRFLTETLPLATLAALATRDDGQPVATDF